MMGSAIENFWSSIRAHALALLVVVFSIAVSGGTVHAQTTSWPNKPIKLIVPYSAGGGTDNSARLLANHLATALGQAIVIENRPGGGSAVGADALAKSSPDGYTLMLATSATLTVGPLLSSKLPYKTSDIMPIAAFGTLPLYVMVSAADGPKTFAELIAKGKSKEISVGTAGNGTMGHMSAELIALRSGLNLIVVPFKGLSAALPDVAAGRVDFAVADTNSAHGLIGAGKLRVLAATTAKRSALEPNIQSMVDVGVKDVDVSAWMVIAAPKATPAPIVARLEAEILKIMGTPQVQQQFTAAGIEPYPLGTEALNRMLAEENTAWKQVVEKSGMKVE